MRFTLGKRHPDWTLKTDEATCFGVYYDPQHDVLISHGELAISRFSTDGRLIWSENGADIFSEGFEMLRDCIRAIDFDHRVYHFDFLTGQLKAEQDGGGNSAGLRASP